MSDLLVVGAGQLGRMMAAAGARLGISVDRMDHTSGGILPGTSSSCFRLCRADILDRYPIITAELEHLLGNSMVEGLRAEAAWCNPRAMQTLPSRDQQKALLDQLQVRTSPWQAIDSREQLEHYRARTGHELVVKTIRDGYDGKGQWVVGADRVDQVPPQVYGAIIAEHRIPFERELSLVGARYRDGQKVFYPLVENYHQCGMLRYTLAPAPACRQNSFQDQAEAMLGTVMDHLEYVGVMAMECFQIQNDLLVNELAPRVHNSGHWTQLGAGLSQFDLHLLALLDRPLTALPVRPGMTLMLNLIGCQWNPAWQGLEDIQCWWYGKSRRENRKLGHINLHGSTAQELLPMAERLWETLDPFHQEMLNLAMEHLRSR